MSSRGRWGGRGQIFARARLDEGGSLGGTATVPRARGDLKARQRPRTPVADRQPFRARPRGPKATPEWLVRYISALVVADVAMAAVASLVAFWVSFGDRPASSMHVGLTVLFPVAWVAVVAMGRAYEPRFLGFGTEEYRRLFHSGVVYAALVGTVSYALDLQIARSYVVVALPGAISLSLLGRYVARQLLHRKRRAGCCKHQIVVVGRERSVAELVRTIRRETHTGYEVVGACVDRPQAGHIEDVPVIGDSFNIPQALLASGADTVAITAWSDLSQSDLRRLSWELEGTGISLLVAPRLTDVAGPRIHIQPVAGLPLLHVEEPEFTGSRRVLKSGVDRLAALTGLVVLAPVLLGVALAVRLTSRGPAVFRQVRVGKGGQTFVMHKFRTMVVGAESRLAELAALNEGDGVLFKIKGDPRVTSVGRFLRRYSLDELPQLIDVLRGRMSLVGPRPPLPAEVEQYPADVRRRLLVKPGLTGMWQVSGRSDLSWEESVRLDLHYVENWSFALDLVIILKTFVAVVARRGAY